jgi:hypothetical protein
MSFKDAATELGVTPTAISHQIRLLEDICGQPLFRRRPRPLVLTGAGERLFPVLRNSFDAFATAIATVSAGAGQRPLRVTSRMHLPADGWFPVCQNGGKGIRKFRWRSLGLMRCWTCAPAMPMSRSAMHAECLRTLPRKKFSETASSQFAAQNCSRRVPDRSSVPPICCVIR